MQSGVSFAIDYIVSCSLSTASMISAAMAGRCLEDLSAGGSTSSCQRNILVGGMKDLEHRRDSQQQRDENLLLGMVGASAQTIANPKLCLEDCFLEPITRENLIY